MKSTFTFYRIDNGIDYTMITHRYAVRTFMPFMVERCERRLSVVDPWLAALVCAHVRHNVYFVYSATAIPHTRFPSRTLFGTRLSDIDRPIDRRAFVRRPQFAVGSWLLRPGVRYRPYRLPCTGDRRPASSDRLWRQFTDLTAVYVFPALQGVICPGTVCCVASFSGLRVSTPNFSVVFSPAARLRRGKCL